MCHCWMIAFALVGIFFGAVGEAWGDESAEVPTFLNAAMVHVSVERADPKAYLSICPNVCELADGRLLIAYHRTTRVDFNGEYSTWTRESRDGGKTWSEARLVDPHL